ncbi:hypothetical protein KA005_50110, partial [bacterium]|nr:hypothetical protein [bacterium]
VFFDEGAGESAKTHIYLNRQAWESALKYSRLLIFLVREQLVTGGSHFRDLRITYAGTANSKD